MSPKQPRKPIRKPHPKPSAASRPKSTGRASAWWAGVDKRKLGIVVGIVVALGVVAFFPVALATDQPTFCPTCHTMQPFYDAWHAGKHKDVWCIDCHVDAGYPNRFLHKFAALQEVFVQFTSSPTFPNYNADVPDSRCLRCHADIPNKPVAGGGFSHALHLQRGVACAHCHATAGHQVTFAALSSAGVLNVSQVTSDTTYVGQLLVQAQGRPSALPGHKPVVCSNCHDQANLECSFCHTPPVNHFGSTCSLCHKPDVPFAQFTHPAVPAPHGIRGRTCPQCHPNGYTTVYCTCHHGNPPRGD